MLPLAKFIADSIGLKDIGVKVIEEVAKGTQKAIENKQQQELGKLQYANEVNIQAHEETVKEAAQRKKLEEAMLYIANNLNEVEYGILCLASNVPTSIQQKTIILLKEWQEKKSSTLDQAVKSLLILCTFFLASCSAKPTIIKNYTIEYQPICFAHAEATVPYLIENEPQAYKNMLENNKRHGIMMCAPDLNIYLNQTLEKPPSWWKFWAK